jgi:hypothetical protein
MQHLHIAALPLIQHVRRQISACQMTSRFMGGGYASETRQRCTEAGHLVERAPWCYSHQTRQECPFVALYVLHVCDLVDKSRVRSESSEEGSGA